MTPRVPRHALALACALLLATCAAAAARADATRVYFIGNSYTYVNDLPTTFTRLAAAGHHELATQMDAHGGELLQGHVADAAAMATLRGAPWDWVVIQEQSEVPASEPARSQVMYPAARVLVRDARATGATPVFLMTWAHQHGWHDAALDYPRMQGRIDDAYFGIARELHTPVAPVGIAWQQVRREHPEFVMWDADGSHPSRAGTYLAACVLYATLFRESPEGLAFHGGVPGGEARALQRTAAATVLSVRGLWDVR